jgi:hypothetical protein
MMHSPWPAPGALERRQREWEIAKALEEARALQSRLEMLGDRSFDVQIIRSLRDSLARELAGLPAIDAVPMRLVR